MSIVNSNYTMTDAGGFEKSWEQDFESIVLRYWIMEQNNERKGKILRVKTGYNPNSSSVGSHIPAFLAFAAGAGSLTIIVMNILNTVSGHIRKRKEQKLLKIEK